MNQGQEMFFNFIIERVQNDKQDAAKELLSECFGKQADGTFGADAAAGFNERMKAMLKPECVEEVMAILNNFGKDHISK